jgi:adenosine/AMP kinase
VDFKVVKVETPDGSNLILGMAHFIKTVEDLHECMVNSTPEIKFGIGFCESSGPCLVRGSGNDEELQSAALQCAFDVGAGHSFILFLRGAFPINVMNALKAIPEVCSIYCATANPVEVMIVETDQGRGILGVVDGMKSKGIETDKDISQRRAFLRRIGYKL